MSWGAGVSGNTGLVAAAGIQPQALLGAYKPLHRVKMNRNINIQYAPIHAYTLKDSRRKEFQFLYRDAFENHTDWLLLASHSARRNAKKTK